MNKLFFDIETIPVEKNKHGILREIYQKKIDDGKKVDMRVNGDGSLERLI